MNSGLPPGLDIPHKQLNSNLAMPLMQLVRKRPMQGLPTKWSEHCLARVLSAPGDLIGLPYRLGAEPARHGATDCINLCRWVLGWYGIEAPVPARSWYRRLHAGDTHIFQEQLELWGTPGETGIIALVQATGNSFGLAVYYETGWLHCSTTNRVVWSPSVKYEARYCHGKSN